jgi:hypothetical protein
VSLFTFLWAWSDFIFASTLDQGGTRQPITLGIYHYIGNNKVSGSAKTCTVVDELSGRCLDVSGASTSDDAAVIQYTSGGQTNQRFTLRAVTALGSIQDFHLVAFHSGKCVDVNQVSTSPGALIHQWTCDPASALSTKKNQIWRLLGKAP